LKNSQKPSRATHGAGRVFETLVYSLKLAKLHKKW